MWFACFCRRLCRPLLVVVLMSYLGYWEQALAQYRSTFPMPNVVGLTVSQAQNEVLAAGRNARATSARAVVTRRTSTAAPAGRIIQQLNTAGTPMRPHLDDVGGKYGEVAFSVVVSTGPPAPTSFSMPNVVGLTVHVAQNRVLSAAGQIRARTATANVVGRRADERPAGVIVEQLEPPGKAMRPNLDDAAGRYGDVAFRVVVSTGPELAPDFQGRHIDTAQEHAHRQRVILDVGPARRDPRVPPDTVVEQSPAPGQPMTRRRVTVYLSAGYPIPNYVNGPFEDAKLDSRKLGFRLEPHSEYQLDIPQGIIFEQAPRPGTLLPMEEPVTVAVSRGWPVPEFIGKHELEADEIARENRIRLNKTVRDNVEVPVGVIFSQQPPAGDLLRPERTVKVAVSRGYPLPDLVGKHERDARQLASELNFKLEINHTPIADRRVGLVHRQRPEPNTRLPFDHPVSIEVSEGWPTPHFLGLEENDARLLAAKQQVPLTVAERREDREVPPGIVISQNPLPATVLPPGQAVTVVISVGYPTPRFVGLADVNARSLAERASIMLDTATTPSLKVATGVVIRQLPDPGAPLPADGTVSITVSSGWPTPDFVGMSEEDANGLASDSRLELVAITPREHVDLAFGRIIEQQPPAGATIPVDRRVRVSLSLGWPVAPAAVGRSASAVRQEFLARHPNAIIDTSETMVTFEPSGNVISQHPQANVKLDRQQRLKLVASGHKPFWIWPVVGLIAFAATWGAFMRFRTTADASTRENPIRTADMGGIRLRVMKDHGIQTTSQPGDDETDRADTREIVKIRVNVDLGEHSAGPVDDKGD